MGTATHFSSGRTSDVRDRSLLHSQSPHTSSLVESTSLSLSFSLWNWSNLRALCDCFICTTSQFPVAFPTVYFLAFFCPIVSFTMCRTTTTAESTNQPSSKESKNKNDSIPWMLRGWLFISRAVPSFTIGGLDFGLTLASCVFLYGVKLAIIQMLVWTQWFPNDLAAAEKGSTFLVPIVHSVNLVLGLAACFLSHKYKPSAKFSGTSCTRYFVGLCSLIRR